MASLRTVRNKSCLYDVHLISIRFVGVTDESSVTKITSNMFGSPNTLYKGRNDCPRRMKTVSDQVRQCFNPNYQIIPYAAPVPRLTLHSSCDDLTPNPIQQKETSRIEHDSHTKAVRLTTRVRLKIKLPELRSLVGIGDAMSATSPVSSLEIVLARLIKRIWGPALSRVVSSGKSNDATTVPTLDITISD